MTTLDIHPEDLFDKLEAGQLSGAENERLEKHLEHCAVCRFEWHARGDFQQEARVLLMQHQAPLLLSQPAIERPIAKPRRRGRAMAWVVGAASFIAAAGALASIAGVQLPTSTPADESPAQAAPSAGPRHAVRSAPVVAAPSSATASVTEPLVAASAVAGEAPARGAPVHAQRGRPLDAHGTEAARSAQSTASSADPDSARSLFAAANRARRQGETARAATLYRNLQQQFPASQEAVLSQVTLSTLLLASDPVQALAGFETYLSRGARPLEAEALVGRARALRRLGRHNAELSTWNEIARRYPNSVYAKEAQERLEAQGGP